MRTRLLVGLLLASTSLLMAQTPGKVEGVDPSSAETLISACLAAKGVGSYTKVQGLQEWISDFEGFKGHLIEDYRGRYDFRLEGNVLWVSMQDVQESSSDGWMQPLISAKGAEQKLISQMVDRLNAARKILPQSEHAAANTMPPIAAGNPQQWPQSATGTPLRPPSPMVGSQPRPSPPPGRAAMAPSPEPAPRDATAPPPTGADATRQALLNFERLEVPLRIDKAKSLVFDYLPSSSRCSEGLCPIRRDGLWGFVDYHGNLVLDFQFHSTFAPYFTHGACLVDVPNSIGHFYIDKEGKPLFGRKVFQTAEPFDEEVTVVSVDYHSFLLDLQGHLLPLPSLTSHLFHEGLAQARSSADSTGSFGFRNTRLQWAIPPAYTGTQEFHEGIVWVSGQTAGGVTKWGAIDKEGKVVVPFMFSHEPAPFSDGLASVACVDTYKNGYVDGTGKLVIPCRYDSHTPFIHGRASVFDRRNGRASIVGGDNPELIDKQGNVVIDLLDGNQTPLLRGHIGELRADGLYMFTSGERYQGLLDSDWNFVLPPTAGLSIMGMFPTDGNPDGLTWADGREGMNHYHGFINRRGEFVLLQLDSKF